MPKAMPPKSTTGGHRQPQAPRQVLVQPSNHRPFYRMWSVHLCSFLVSSHLRYINDIS
jgi:hypothetical protein